LRILTHEKNKRSFKLSKWFTSEKMGQLNCYAIIEGQRIDGLFLFIADLPGKSIALMARD
jgi:hypothetical protein